DFLYFMLSRVGADTMMTPREIIRSYLTALGILYTDKTKTLPDVYESVAPKIQTQNTDTDLTTLDI
ncbi:MAG: hypothetical protein KBS59_00345, partial [Clostridiales bacterium]|nr:hypothetical protein [Clostridiales bacterium]